MPKIYAAPPKQVLTIGGGVLFTWDKKVPELEIHEWVAMFLDMDLDEERGLFTDARAFSGLVLCKFEGAAHGDTSLTLMHSTELDGPQSEAQYRSDVEDVLNELVSIVTTPELLTKAEADAERMAHGGNIIHMGGGV